MKKERKKERMRKEKTGSQPIPCSTKTDTQEVKGLLQHHAAGGGHLELVLDVLCVKSTSGTFIQSLGHAWQCSPMGAACKGDELNTGLSHEASGSVGSSHTSIHHACSLHRDTSSGWVQGGGDLAPPRARGTIPDKVVHELS